MKQTAVDILYKFLYEMKSFNEFNPYSFNHKEIFEKAKEIEKQQISDAWVNGGSTLSAKNAEQYYNETFNKEV